MRIFRTLVMGEKNIKGSARRKTTRRELQQPPPPPFAVAVVDVDAACRSRARERHRFSSSPSGISTASAPSFYALVALRGIFSLFHPSLYAKLTKKKRTRNIKNNNKKKNRFLVGSSDSESDEARRVVRSARDRAADQLRSTCEEIRVRGVLCFMLRISFCFSARRGRRRRRSGNELMI